MQSWLWAAPAKHSSRQIEEVLERAERHLTQLPDAVMRRYTRGLAARALDVAPRIAEPVRMIEVACLLRYCLLVNGDRLLLMVRRRVADSWRIFRRELLRVLNRGESANALKRAIYAARVAAYQAKHPREMQAV